MDLVEGRFSTGQGQTVILKGHRAEKSSSSSTTQRWIPLFLSEQCTRMYLPLQRADQFLASQMQGGNRVLFSTRAKFEDKNSCLERTFFFFFLPNPSAFGSRAW